MTTSFEDKEAQLNFETPSTASVNDNNSRGHGSNEALEDVTMEKAADSAADNDGSEDNLYPMGLKHHRRSHPSYHRRFP